MSAAVIDSPAPPRRRRRKPPRVRPVPVPVTGNPADVRECDPAAAALAKLEVAELLATLPPLERIVLTLRYGLGGEALTHQQIGRRLGIGPERCAAIVARLRDRAGVGDE